MPVGILPAVAAMAPRIAVQKPEFVEGSRNLRQTPWFVKGFAFDKPLSSKFVEKKFVEGSLKVITSSLRPTNSSFSKLETRNYKTTSRFETEKKAASFFHSAGIHLSLKKISKLKKRMRENKQS